MKKVILVAVMAMVSLASCKKEEDLGCRCGTVLGDNYEQAATSPETFRYIIFENKCTGEVDKIYAVDFEIPPYEDTVGNKIVGMEWCLRNKEW